MRLAWLVVMVGAAGVARADKRVQDLTPGYEREVAGCEVQVNGLTKVATGAAALARTVDVTERAELERDAEQLGKGLALIQTYCTEVAAMVGFLKARAAAPYKTVERELDARDNKIRKLRREAKQQIEELQPITRKLIPRIARAPAVKLEDRRVPAKFPSGRSVELPMLAGTWRLSGTSVSDTAEYVEKALTAGVTTRPFGGATCEQQRHALALKADATELVELELGAAKEAGVVWHLRYTRSGDKPALVDVMCLPTTKAGCVLATATVLPAEQTKLADELAKVMLRMLAAQRP